MQEGLGRVLRFGQGVHVERADFVKIGRAINRIGVGGRVGEHLDRQGGRALAVVDHFKEAGFGDFADDVAVEAPLGEDLLDFVCAAAGGDDEHALLALT